MIAKYGAGIAAGGATIAMGDPSVAVGFVSQHGVVGVLVVIALVLWAKSERQEKKADEYREARRLDEKIRDEKLNGTLGGLSEAIRAMHKHCEDRNR
jgi:hypothetical protein